MIHTALEVRSVYNKALIFTSCSQKIHDEIAVMKKLQHVNVVQVTDHIIDDSSSIDRAAVGSSLRFSMMQTKTSSIWCLSTKS